MAAILSNCRDPDLLLFQLMFWCLVKSVGYIFDFLRPSSCRRNKPSFRIAIRQAFLISGMSLCSQQSLGVSCASCLVLNLIQGAHGSFDGVERIDAEIHKVVNTSRTLRFNDKGGYLRAGHNRGMYDGERSVILIPVIRASMDSNTDS